MRHLILTLVLIVGTVSPSFAGSDCWCRGSQGERFEMGEVTCFTISGRTFTAQCDMSLNTMAWRELSQGCTIS